MTTSSLSSSSCVRLVPLGGLGEIGMNCLALECEEGIVVIDCGVTFPHSDLGVDVYHPDFSYLEARRDRVRGVVITHGHEDHIGALPYLLRRMDVPIWAPEHALALACEHLEERGFECKRLRLHTLVPGREYDVGPIVVEPVRVAHSIVDACALILRTPVGIIFHTGDFKFDPTPPDGEPTDVERLEEIGDEGVRLLLSDSTNVDASSPSGSERDVGIALEKMIGELKHRVVVGMFASNVQRLQLVGDIAHKFGRKVCLLGRSANTHVRVALGCGRLRWPSDLLIPSEAAASIARDKLLVIASGTQGESLAALSRLSTRTHPALCLDPGDTVIMSSRIIPGNDPVVFRMIGNFIRQAVDIRTRITDPSIHVSGHAHRDEQQRMIRLIRPQSFMPVHGTLHHLKRHADLAKEMGLSSVMLAEDGDIVELAEDSFRKVDFTEVGKVATYDGEEIPDDVLRERESLARTGIAVVTLTVDIRGQLLCAPTISTRGVLDEDEDFDLLRAAALDVSKALAGRPFACERPTDEQIVEVAQRVVRRMLDGITGRRPVAVVHVVRP